VRSILYICQRTGAAETGHIENGVDVSEGVKRWGEHRFDLVFLADVAMKRSDRIAKFGASLLLASTDIGGEHPGALAD
jgi:hypothetical protein